MSTDFRQRYPHAPPGLTGDWDPITPSVPSGSQMGSSVRRALELYGADALASGRTNPLDDALNELRGMQAQSGDGGLGTAFRMGVAGVGTAFSGLADYGVRQAQAALPEKAQGSHADRILSSFAESTERMLGRSQERAQNIYTQLSPEAQDRLARQWTTLDPDETIWQGGPLEFVNSVALKVAQVAPSSLVTLVPAVVMMRAGMGPRAILYLGATEGTISLGGVAAELVEEIQSAEEAELMESPRYRELRETLDVDEARRQLATEAQGYAPLVAGIVVGAISATAGRYLQPIVAPGAGGGLSLGQRVARGAVVEAIPESFQEGFETYIENVAAQVYDLTRDPWEGVGERFVEGGVLGGIMGGATTGALGQRPRSRRGQTPEGDDTTTDGTPPIVPAGAVGAGAGAGPLQTPMQVQSEGPLGQRGLEEVDERFYRGQPKRPRYAGMPESVPEDVRQAIRVRTAFRGDPQPPRELGTGRQPPRRQRVVDPGMPVPPEQFDPQNLRQEGSPQMEMDLRLAPEFELQPGPDPVQGPVPQRRRAIEPADPNQMQMEFTDRQNFTMAPRTAQMDLPLREGRRRGEPLGRPLPPTEPAFEQRSASRALTRPGEPTIAPLAARPDPFTRQTPEGRRPVDENQIDWEAEAAQQSPFALAPFERGRTAARYEDVVPEPRRAAVREGERTGAWRVDVTRPDRTRDPEGRILQPTRTLKARTQAEAERKAERARRRGLEAKVSKELTEADKARERAAREAAQPEPTLEERSIPLARIRDQISEMKAGDRGRDAVLLPRETIRDLRRARRLDGVREQGVPLANFDGRGSTLLVRDAEAANTARQLLREGTPAREVIELMTGERQQDIAARAPEDQRLLDFEKKTAARAEKLRKEAEARDRAEIESEFQEEVRAARAAGKPMTLNKLVVPQLRRMEVTDPRMAAAKRDAISIAQKNLDKTTREIAQLILGRAAQRFLAAMGDAKKAGNNPAPQYLTFVQTSDTVFNKTAEARYRRAWGQIEEVTTRLAEIKDSPENTVRRLMLEDQRAWLIDNLTAIRFAHRPVVDFDMGLVEVATRLDPTVKKFLPVFESGRTDMIARARDDVEAGVPGMSRVLDLLESVASYAMPESVTQYRPVPDYYIDRLQSLIESSDAAVRNDALTDLETLSMMAIEWDAGRARRPSKSKTDKTRENKVRERVDALRREGAFPEDTGSSPAFDMAAESVSPGVVRAAESALGESSDTGAIFEQDTSRVAGTMAADAAAEGMQFLAIDQSKTLRENLAQTASPSKRLRALRRANFAIRQAMYGGSLTTEGMAGMVRGRATNRALNRLAKEHAKAVEAAKGDESLIAEAAAEYNMKVMRLGNTDATQFTPAAIFPTHILLMEPGGRSTLPGETKVEALQNRKDRAAVANKKLGLSIAKMEQVIERFGDTVFQSRFPDIPVQDFIHARGYLTELVRYGRALIEVGNIGDLSTKTANRLSGLFEGWAKIDSTQTAVSDLKKLLMAESYNAHILATQATTPRGLKPRIKDTRDRLAAYAKNLNEVRAARGRMYVRETFWRQNPVYTNQILPILNRIAQSLNTEQLRPYIPTESELVSLASAMETLRINTEAGVSRYVGRANSRLRTLGLDISDDGTKVTVSGKSKVDATYLNRAITAVLGTDNRGRKINRNMVEVARRAGLDVDAQGNLGRAHEGITSMPSREVTASFIERLVNARVRAEFGIVAELTPVLEALGITQESSGLTLTEQLQEGAFAESIIEAGGRIVTRSDELTAASAEATQVASDVMVYNRAAVQLAEDVKRVKSENGLLAAEDKFVQTLINARIATRAGKTMLNIKPLGKTRRLPSALKKGTLRERLQSFAKTIDPKSLDSVQRLRTVAEQYGQRRPEWVDERLNNLTESADQRFGTAIDRLGPNALQRMTAQRRFIHARREANRGTQKGQKPTNDQLQEVENKEVGDWNENRGQESFDLIRALDESNTDLTIGENALFDLTDAALEGRPITFTEFYQNLLEQSSNAPPILRDVLQRLAGLGIEGNVFMVDSLVNKAGVEVAGRTTLNPDGSVSIRINQAYMDSLAGTGVDPSVAAAHTLIHEGVHAATVDALRADSALRSRMEALMRAAQEASTDPDLRGYYGENTYPFTDVFEFVAEAYSNPRLQAALDATPIRGQQDVSLWQRMWSFVQDLLGLSRQDQSLLEAVLTNTDALFVGRNLDSQKGTVATLDLPDAVSELPNLVKRHLDQGRGLRRARLRTGEGLRRVFSKTALGIMTMEQLSEWYGRHFESSKGNPLKAYMQAFFRRDARNTEYMVKADQMSRKWTALTEKNNDASYTLSSIMTDATMFGVHPDLAVTHAANAHLQTAKQKARHAELSKEFNALPDEFQRLYRELKQWYVDSHRREVGQLTINSLRAMLTQAANAPMRPSDFDSMTIDDVFNKSLNTVQGLEAEYGNLLSADQRALIAQMGTIPSHRQGPYFPLRRDGEYVVYAQRTLKPETFTDAADARARRNELIANDPTLDVRVSQTDAGFQVIATEKVFSSFENFADAKEAEARLIGEYGQRTEEGGDGATTVQFRRDLTDKRVQEIGNTSLRQLLSQLKGNVAAQAAVKNLYLQSLSERSFRKREMKRAQRRGVDHERQHRSFTQYSQQVGYYLAQLEFGWKMGEALTDMSEMIRSHVDESQISTRKLQEIYETMTARDRLMSDPTAVPRIVKNGSEFSHFMLLTTPSYWMINASQPYVVSIPWLASHHGLGEASRAMFRAQKLIASPLSKETVNSWAGLKALISKSSAESAYGVVDQVKAHMRRELGDASQRYIEMLEQLEQSNIINLSFIAELREIADGVNTSLTRRVLDASRVMAHMTEVNNRIVTATAAYELAYKANGGNQQAAIDFAHEAVSKTQFNYSSSNKPAFFQREGLAGKYSPLAFQFMQYPQHLYALMAMSARQAWLDPTMTPAQRQQGRRALAGLFASHMAVGGLIGISLQPIKWFGGLLIAMMGGGADDWKEVMSGRLWDRTVRNVSHTIFGPAGEVIAAGLPRLAGTDLSQRMALGMAYFLDFDTRTSESFWGSMFLNFGGPLPSIATNMHRGVRQIMEGDYRKGIENMSPKILRDIVRFWRFMDEGVTNASGMTILRPDQLGVRELTMQLLGFQPAKINDRYAADRLVKTREREASDERQRLIRTFRNADTNRERQRVQREIWKFNRENPHAKVMARDLTRNMITTKQREQRIQRYGVDLNSRNRPYYSEVEMYGVPE